TAGATDIADGAVARATHRQTRLGAYLDAEADLSFWLALALTLAARRRLPRWLVALLVGRFLAPFAVALASYFGWVRRLPIGSTVTGKATGIAQTAVIGVAVLPTPARRKLAPALPWLYALTAGLLLAAPLAQFVKLARNSK
ncbi:MAG: CDP-alcohol phosphatidyltransferase family protein, partial [Ktedonobacterales bacterium]